MVTTTIKRGYKQTEIGVIPEDWDVLKLGELGSCLIGLTYKPTDVKNDGFLVLRSSNVQNNKLSFLDNVYVSSEVPDKIKIKKGDILICARNGSRDLIGKSALIKTELKDTTFGAFMSVFRADKYNNFLFYQFQSNLIKKQINEHLGATINQITNKSLSSFRVAVPLNISEQSIIATILYDIDTLIEQLEKLITKKKAVKQGTMQQLLTGKKRLPGFNGEWEERKLEVVCDHIRSGIYGAEKEDINLVSFKVATTAHITDTDTWNKKVMEERFFSRNQIDQYSPKTGDLVVVKSSGIAERIKSGKLGFVSDKMSGKFIFSNFLLLLRPKIIDPLFLYYYLTSYPVKSILPNLCEASTYPNLRINEYLNISVPFPTEKEQTTISTILSNMDKEIELLEQRRDKYIMLKNGMMQQLLTGTIRIYGNK